MWLNCVEEIVFIDDDFNSDLPNYSSGSLAIHRRKVQILQAAFVVCLFQTWEGTDSSKGRIRRYRFATLVSVGKTPVVRILIIILTLTDCPRHWNCNSHSSELCRASKA